MFLAIYRRLVWLSDEDVHKGYAVDFYSLSMHAISRDVEAYPQPCIYTQVSSLFLCMCIFAPKIKVWCSLLNGSRQKLLQKRFWHFRVCEFPSYKCGLAQIENGNETEEEFEEDEDAQEPLEPEINGTPSDLSHVTEMRLVPKDSSVRILYLLMYTFCPSVRVISSLVILLMLWKYFILIAEVWERGGTVDF